MLRLSLVVALAPLFGPASARAEVRQCHVVDMTLTPATPASPDGERHEPSQMVVWIERADGTYVDTLFITAQTGRYGLGNRPGRFDFNSGPMWPYGRRTTTFPVWSHKHGLAFPTVIFQTCCQAMGVSSDDPAFCDTVVNDPMLEPPFDRAHADCSENNLSHPFNQSSRENWFCQPFQPSDAKWMQADAMTCATNAFTDKGTFSTTATSRYPPRTDLVRAAGDAAAVEMFRAMNPFDGVSRATPASGAPAVISWPLPTGFAMGDYVAWVEVSQAFDFNDSYSPLQYPALPPNGPTGIQWSAFGLPYRGQPSIVYRVPFALGATESSASTQDYAGYGDPDGRDGAIRPPDATITTDTPGSGASRLQLVSEAGAMYRVKVTARPEIDYADPGAIEPPRALAIEPTRVTLRFVAPGDDGAIGKVTGYEIRYRANDDLSEDTFDGASVATASVVPVEPGQLQTFELGGLLPETDYAIGIRALDNCQNHGPLTVVKLTTANRPVAAVDWCFVATAAYGSPLANDVELLRRTRDSILARSVLGELAIETYYTFSPALAGAIGESELLRASARAVLAPIVAWVRRLSA